LYVDGLECSHLEGGASTALSSALANSIDFVDYRLRHKLVLFGGGKQAQAKGGDIRRLMLHNRVLSPADVQLCATNAADANPTKRSAVLNIQALWRGYCPRKHKAAKEKTEKTEEDEKRKAEEKKKRMKKARKKKRKGKKKARSDSEDEDEEGEGGEEEE
jgi:hypothetical protein